MTDLFRSALNYVSSSVAGTSAGRSDHELVGQTVEIGGLKLRIRSLIAEGGFALVFCVTDSSNRPYALKRLLAADREAADDILREIRFLRLLTGHPGIIRYVQAASLSPQESGHGRAEFLLLTELCSGGPVVDALRRQPFSPYHVIRIFNSTCKAVEHMHSSQSPPIIHRDLKIENLLFDSHGCVKLCDFGSATTDTFQPDPSWSANKRSQLEDEMTRHTTPMYRAPEMLDLYSDFPIGPALDIWALGCILYYLCYRTHPFEDSAKLRIINAKYTLPENETPFTVFHPLIASTLQIDPRDRPSVAELCERVSVLAVALDADLKTPLVDLMPPNSLSPSPSAEPLRDPSPAPPPRPPPHRPPPPESVNQQQSQQPSASAIFSSLKGSAGSLFKNIKDTSNKVVQSVQAGYGGKGPDVSYITSKIIVAPLPDGVPEALAAPAEDVLRAFLEQRHRARYAMYNLGTRKLRGDYGGRVSEVPLPSASSGRVPSLHSLFLLCRNMSLWLRQEPNNVCVLTGSEAHSLTVSVAFVLYCRLVPNPLAAFELVAARRCRVRLAPSVHRYLDYTTKLCQAESPVKLHNRPVTLMRLRVEPLPLFNRLHSGCRPFVEVWVGSERALSTSQEYEKLRAFELPDAKVIDLQLGVTVCGDVSLALFHARSTLGTKVQGRLTALPIFRISFHTSLLDTSQTSIELSKGDLDEIDEDGSKYPDPFRVILEVRVADQDRPFDGGEPAYWNHDPKSSSVRLAVGSREERDNIYHLLGLDRPSSAAAAEIPESQPSVPKSQANAAGGDNNASFFSNLEWSGADSVEKPVQNNASLEQKPEKQFLEQKPEKQFKSPFMDTAEAYERMAGIRVSAPPPEEPEREPSPPVVEEADLLDLGSGAPHKQEADFDPVAQLLAGSRSPTKSASSAAFFDMSSVSQPQPQAPPNGDLLQDWSDNLFQQSKPQQGLHAPNTMTRNVSAPSFSAGPRPPGADPFAQFMNGTGVAGWQQQQRPMMGAPRPAMPQQPQPGWRPSVPPQMRPMSAGGQSSGPSTPTFQRPNYSRSNFADPNAPSGGTGMKPKLQADAFDDLLSSQGFNTTTSKQPSTIGSLKREVEIEGMGPVQIKVRDWTKGKERNIRALIGSLHEVLWEGADKWEPMPMSQLLTGAQVKKAYRRACLVVHPDKLTGTPHEDLAKAVFTELNDAWNDFEQAGQPSL